MGATAVNLRRNMKKKSKEFEKSTIPELKGYKSVPLEGLNPNTLQLGLDQGLFELVLTPKGGKVIMDYALRRGYGQRKQTKTNSK